MPNDAPATPAGTEKVTVLPGDAVQVIDKKSNVRGAFGIVRETFGWGLGVDMVAIALGKVSENYMRFKPDQVAVIGPAALVKPEVARDRRLAVEAAEEAAREAGA